MTVEDFPVSPFVRKVAVLSSAGVFLDGFDIAIFSVALLFIGPQLHPTPLETGYAGAAVVAGMFFGSLVLGNLADRLGRRAIYLLDLLFFVVFAILTAVSFNIWELIAFRFLLGIGLGADYPISSTITAEFAPKLHRGRLLVMTIGAFTFGSFCAYAVGLALFNAGPNNWRYMLAAGVIPALIVMFMRRSIPESPSWLKAAGRDEEAAKVTAEIAALAKVTTADSTASSTRTRADSKLPPAPNGPAPTPSAPIKLGAIGQLFRKPLLTATIVAAGGWFLFDLGNYATIVFTPTILNKIRGGNEFLSVVVSLGVEVIGLIGISICFFLVDRIGRRTIQIWGFGALGLVFIILGIFPNGGFALFAIFFVLVNLFNQGPGITTYLFAGELFPTSVRSSGHAVATAASRVGAFLGIVALPLFVAGVGLGTALIAFGIADLLAMGLTIWLAPEMRGRKLLS